MTHTNTTARITTKLFEADGDLWLPKADGTRRRYKCIPKQNAKRMYVDGKYIPQTHPLWKSGRYESFNDAAFSSFSNYSKVPEGDVYIITNKAWPEWVKIGKAVSAKDRLKSYQTSDPFRAYELHCKFTVSDRHTFETEAHQIIALRASEFKNEWFKISADKAQRILEAVHE